jgi:hypothetical protein
MMEGLKEGTERAMHTLTQHSEEWGILASGSILFLLSFGPIGLARDIVSSAVFFLFFIVVLRGGDLCGRAESCGFCHSVLLLLLLSASFFACFVLLVVMSMVLTADFSPREQHSISHEARPPWTMVTMVRRLSALHTAAGRPTGAVYP